MKLRDYHPGDIHAILDLFYLTVHSVNAADYTPAQLDAWAPENPDAARWALSLRAHDSVVAEEGGRLVGFADLEAPGHFDRLYVHKDFQSRGIGTALAEEIEARARRLGAEELAVEASITAKPFFEKRGYTLIRQQMVKRHGEDLTNFVMRKNLIG